ncbi:hypothetical protein [Photorhabdus sp. RM71S]|uniref:hypothetical protein n=1 Tax=Photorhabdus sp. RM71S TaxID=3342824 RepID=UPI0036DEC5DD
MSDVIIVEGDQLQFEPMFGNRQVIPTGPAIIHGSGQLTINQKKVCILGDETKVQVSATYQIPGYTPGTGMLTIVALESSQQTPRCSSGAPLIVKGQQFIARFTPLQPAQTIGPAPTPDISAPSMGKGRIIPSQFFAVAG